MERNNTVYQECQSFFTWWVCLLLVFVLGAGIYAGWSNADAGNRAEFFLGSLSWGLILVVLVCLLIFLVRLRSRIDAEGVHIRFFPFVWQEKTWLWEDIGEVYVKRYSPWEYGGWGYRLSGAGTAYSTKGNYGIQLVLKKSGSRILIGTQNPEEVQRILSQFKSAGHEE